MLEAWDLGVATMRPGERAEFVADASLAYGEDGAGDDVPPGAALRFTVELLGGGVAASPPPAMPATPAAEREPGLPEGAAALARAAAAKERGNGLVREAKFAEARAAYEEALGLLRGLSDASAEVAELRARGQLQCSSHLNLAQCCLKLEDFAAAARHATEALGLEPKTITTTRTIQNTTNKQTNKQTNKHTHTHT